MKVKLLTKNKSNYNLEISTLKLLMEINKRKDKINILSAFYYARTLDLQNAEINQEFVINTFFDREMYPLKIKFIGKEKVKTKLGDFNCLKFRPMVEKGRVFKEEEDLTLWISDDNNKVPVRLKANLLVGSIKMDLVEYKNLSEKLNQVSE